MAYQIMARYHAYDQFGEWQVGAFWNLEDAREYVERTTARYRGEYGHDDFEMSIVAISDEQAHKWNVLLNTILD